MLNHKAAPRQRQFAHLKEVADPGVYEETLRLMPLVEQLDMRARLRAARYLAAGAAQALVPAQYDLFKQNVAVLVQADNEIDMFEWSLQRILLHELEGALREAESAARPLPHSCLGSGAQRAAALGARLRRAPGPGVGPTRVRAGEAHSGTAGACTFVQWTT